ncbi:hypothetical protein Ahy_A01g000003 [Arachis hypogaea]|uniref:Aminotransferase-like plant mobile domain-containing protein n=1 Tax=Arachis hypogaea TaxID=3818 RepID=A0A445EJ18_ARAHY|nr:hypothetical protein Ahy_A01g000003 [Arachis hypogaea]
MTWIIGLKDRTVLVDDIQIQRYVKCHIMLLFGAILFGDKSGVAVHWKFLPLLYNFVGIIQFSWGSTCLAHLNRSLCRATCVDCKEMDGPLTLLLTWVWIRLPFLAPILCNPRLFPIANKWRNLERENYACRYHTFAHYRRLLDDMQEGHGVPNQERDLGASHGKVLTGPKNQDWSDTNSFWTNRYSHVLAYDLVPLHYPLEIYMHWYRGTFGAHLQISDLVFQENPKGAPVHNQEDQQQELPAKHYYKQ